MHLVKHLVYIVPAFALVACDTAAIEPAPAAALTIDNAASITEPSECKSARRDFEPVVADAQRDNATCGADSDCTVAVVDTLCLGASAHAVSFVGFDAFVLKAAKADARWCATVPDSCGVGDDVAAVTAVCNAGLCELAAGKTTCDADETVTSEGCLDCEDSRGKAQAALAVAVDAANQCASDAECVAVTDMTGCATRCGVAINPANAGAFSERMSDIVTDYCSGDCAVAVDCLATKPACVQNRCTLVSADQ